MLVCYEFKYGAELNDVAVAVVFAAVVVVVAVVPNGFVVVVSVVAAVFAVVVVVLLTHKKLIRFVSEKIVFWQQFSFRNG